jgi:hypothetical protein
MAWGIIPEWFKKYHAKGYRLVEDTTFLYLEKNKKTLPTFVNTVDPKIVLKEIKNDIKSSR